MRPLVDSEVDLRDFAYMPLDVVRLRDSELFICSSGDEFRAAVVLWCASWHQVPAASLPDSDAILATLAGFGRDVSSWLSVREVALKNWIKCDDGRLYHPVVAEKANKAWEVKKNQRSRTQAARDARWRDRSTGSVTEFVTESVTESKRRDRDRDRDREYNSRESQKETRAQERAAFARFWELWPNKVGKPAAEAKFAKLSHDVDAIIAGVRRYIVARRPDQPWLNPATFLNQRRWEDEPAPIHANAPAGPTRKFASAAQIRSPG